MNTKKISLLGILLSMYLSSHAMNDDFMSPDIFTPKVNQEVFKGTQEIFQGFKNVAKNYIPGNDEQLPTDAVQIKLPESGIVSKQVAATLGIGAVALVVVGGCTYVLYKNGTFKKLSDVLNKNRTAVARLALGSVCLLTGIWACKKLLTIDSKIHSEIIAKMRAQLPDLITSIQVNMPIL